MLRGIICAGIFGTLLFCSKISISQESHEHLTGEKLGRVKFPITCKPAAQAEFERAVALLHSFAYAAAEASFRHVAATDPQCAIAHWGVAMANFHQLWDPPITPDALSIGRQEIRRAQETTARSERERSFIEALRLVFDAPIPYQTRILDYETAMQKVAAAYRDDAEAQVFYALALLASASPLDKTHSRQKKAAEILEPLYREFPQHPGIAHYLIHAYDNAELASKGVAAARAYSRIASSAPHALHMPSHIFTRLGMWDESIASNRAASLAAHQQGVVAEELHAMDYLVYAYLQEGRDEEANQVIQQLNHMQKLDQQDFIVAYASAAMPIRYAVERGQWIEAARITPQEGAAPHVIAIAVWARALGLARSGRSTEGGVEIERLHQLEKQLRVSGNDYWAKQVGIQAIEVEAWQAQSQGKTYQARRLLRQAADEEDAIEKLPVTPGPIVPAREQLGELLLEQNHPELAVTEFRTALKEAPKRRGALNGLSRAVALIASARHTEPHQHNLENGNTVRHCRLRQSIRLSQPSPIQLHG